METAAQVPFWMPSKSPRCRPELSVWVNAAYPQGPPDCGHHGTLARYRFWSGVAHSLRKSHSQIHRTVAHMPFSTDVEQGPRISHILTRDGSKRDVPLARGVVSAIFSAPLPRPRDRIDFCRDRISEETPYDWLDTVQITGALRDAKGVVYSKNLFAGRVLLGSAVDTDEAKSRFAPFVARPDKYHVSVNHNRIWVWRLAAIKVCILEDIVTNEHAIEHGTAGPRHVVATVPSWIEALGWSASSPRNFYGSVNAVFSAKGEATEWCSVLVVGRFRGTLQSLLISTMPDLDQAPDDANWAPVMRDICAQLMLCTIPLAKRGGMVSHNDLKADNIFYRRCNADHVRVRLTGLSALGLAFDEATLAIPTHGRRIVLGDYAWARLATLDYDIVSQAPHTELEAPMRTTNSAADFCQAAFTVMRVLKCHFKDTLVRPTGEVCPAGGWDLLYKDMLTIAYPILDLGPAHYRDTFYGAISSECTLSRWGDYIRTAVNMYTVIDKQESSDVTYAAGAFEKPHQ